MDEHSAFAFVGCAGRVSVLKEARSRGAGYWYAYRTQEQRTHKRYLGPTLKVTFDRLEQAAKALQIPSRGADDTSARTSDQRVVPSAGDARAGGERFRLNAKSQSEQELALLSPKLFRPQLTTPLVERTRLLGDLDAVRSHPLTLISASAGSGKTTLLSAWAALTEQSRERLDATEGAESTRIPPKLAWLSLDELDDEPTRFWTSVIAALRTCQPHCGQVASAMLHSPGSPPLSTILLALLQDLKQVESEIILILDDYHVISDQVIFDSMRFFLEHCPATLHLVLATRSDPELPLARLRVRSHLIEIRDRDLRFTASEAAYFLTHGMQLSLSEDEVAALHQRTEGWTAGLQLAALALSKHESPSTWIKDFTGSHRFMLDYVRQEILAQLPETLRDFLLQTSILPRLTATLCQAVTASPTLRDSQEMLEALERRNLFLVPLDEERRWYRQHDLFREALLAALRATQPEAVPVLHHRAAAFYEAQESWSEAIAHHLAATDYSAAARLIEQSVEQFWVRGEAETVAHWVLALPQEKVYQHARLVLTAALYLLITVTYASGDQRARTQAEVRQLMGRVEAALRSQRLPSELAGVDSGMGNQSPVVHGGAKAQITANDPSVGPVAPAGVQAAPTADEARLRRRLRMLRMYLEFLDAAVQGQHERIGHMQPDIEEMQDALYRDENEVAIWQLVPISWAFVLHYTVRQEGAHLLPRLLATKKLMRWSGSPFAIIKVMQYVAFAALEAGQLRVAYEESRAALDLIEQIAGYALLKGYFALVQVDVLYQWNRLEEARSWLHTLLEDASNWHHLDLLGAGNFYLMQVELARGDWTAAQQALRALEDLVRREHFGTHPGVLPTMQAMWWLAQGQVADAAAWAGGIIYPEGAWDVTLYDAFPIVVRVYFAQRRWGEALALLDRWQRHLDRPAANIRVTITHLAQMLVALHQAGKREEARETATRLFALTEPEGYLRVYLDEGEPMRQALRALGTHHQQDQPRAPSITTYASKLLAALDQEQRRPRHGTAAASATTRETAPQASRDADPGVPIEPLSPQEHRVLRLLVAGQTYTEMAEALVVSLNTIKTQVSSIYRKLGVSRRAEAIARMSDLHLL